MDKSQSSEGQTEDKNSKIPAHETEKATSGLRIIVTLRNGTKQEVELSPSELKTMSRSVFFMHAQAYYKILECVAASPIGWADVELNRCYLWVVKTIEGQLSRPEFKDFPGKFEPYVENIFPSSGLGDLGWEDGVAPHAEDFLGRAQAFVESELLIPLDKDSPAYKVFELKKQEVRSAIEAAEKYYAETTRRFKVMLSQVKTGQQNAGQTKPESRQQEGRCQEANGRRVDKPHNTNRSDTNSEDSG